MLRIPFEDLLLTLTAALKNLGLAPDRAEACARLFAETTRDGVYTHGINRFPRFAAYIQSGAVDPKAVPTLVSAFGALERWDGHRGPGNLAAWHSMERAIALAQSHGIGCVAIRNTTHWMRAGAYGLQAADSGMVGLCFTNTMPNLPPWGGTKALLGNNPMVLSVPRAGGAHFLIDFAMSQFSYGALDSYIARGEQLPLAGGFDLVGNLTTDPAAIVESQRSMPIGYWKGSALSMMLDVIAATLSFGRASHQVSTDPVRETEVCQVFIAINPEALGEVSAIGDEIIASLRLDANSTARYPGERQVAIRADNMEKGVPAEEEVWAQIQQIAGGS